MTAAVLVGLTGCAGGPEPARDEPPGPPRSDLASAGATPPTPAAAAAGAAAAAAAHRSGTGSGSSRADRRARLLAALRSAGVPVSRSGDREVRAAEAACRLVARGAGADDLGRRLVERYPFIPEAKAQNLARIVVSTYCSSR